MKGKRVSQPRSFLEWPRYVSLIPVREESGQTESFLAQEPPERVAEVHLSCDLYSAF